MKGLNGEKNSKTFTRSLALCTAKDQVRWYMVHDSSVPRVYALLPNATRLTCRPSCYPLHTMHIVIVHSAIDASAWSNRLARSRVGNVSGISNTSKRTIKCSFSNLYPLTVWGHLRASKFGSKQTPIVCTISSSVQNPQTRFGRVDGL